ncbi:MAG: hypothetical protein U1E51_00650 [Candidatus Binatia bacterium]|nr:hypothetical protein [Candidatus Binatia bacterium]
MRINSKGVRHNDHAIIRHSAVKEQDDGIFSPKEEGPDRKGHDGTFKSNAEKGNDDGKAKHGEEDREEKSEEGSEE